MSTCLSTIVSANESESPLHLSKCFTISDPECYELTMKSTTVTYNSKSMSKLDTTVVSTNLSSNESFNTYEDKYVHYCNFALI